MFVESVLSEEFINLTGVRDAKSPTDRVYIGVSVEMGNRIASGVNGRRIDEVNLRSIDHMVVEPFFLDKYPEKPRTVTLTSTPDGYQVKAE